MERSEAIKHNALNKLLHRLSTPHKWAKHGEAHDLTSQGDYYTTMTFRTSDLELVRDIAEAALQGHTPAEAQLVKLREKQAELEQEAQGLEKLILSQEVERQAQAGKGP